jgi:hypothetical protein
MMMMTRRRRRSLKKKTTMMLWRDKIKGKNRHPFRFQVFWPCDVNI